MSTNELYGDAGGGKTGWREMSKRTKKPRYEVLTIDDRIRAALAAGALDTYSLAQILWPQVSNPQAWRNKSGGGPPAWTRTLGKAIKRMGISKWYDCEKCRSMVSLETH